MSARIFTNCSDKIGKNKTLFWIAVPVVADNDFVDHNAEAHRLAEIIYRRLEGDGLPVTRDLHRRPVPLCTMIQPRHE